MDENLGLIAACGIHMGSFDLEPVKVILGSFSALFSKLAHYNSKMTNHSMKQMEICESGMYV